MRRGGRKGRAVAEAVSLPADRLGDDDLMRAVVTVTASDVATPSTLLIACGALAREILAVIEINGLPGMALECLPATLHNRPEHIPEAVRDKVRAARARGIANIHVVYADCGTGGLLDRVCEEEGVTRIAGPHCYAFFDGLDAFAARAEEETGAFFLTDFLARQFDTLIWKGMGLDRHSDLRDLYFGNYDRVVHLAQTDDAALDARARAAAERLGLRYVRRATGYGELADFVRAAAAQAGDPIV